MDAPCNGRPGEPVGFGSESWSCPAMADTIPFGQPMEVSHGGKQKGAVSARVQSEA